MKTLLKMAAAATKPRPGDLLLSVPREHGIGRRLTVELPQSTKLGHSAIYVGGGQVVEAQISQGVIKMPYKQWADNNNYVIARVSAGSTERRKAAERAKDLVGSPFSIIKAIKAFIMPRSPDGEVDMSEVDSLFCSAVVGVAYRDVDLGIPKHPLDILPKDLLKSPKVRIIDREFREDDGLKADLYRIRNKVYRPA